MSVINEQEIEDSLSDQEFKCETNDTDQFKKILQNL